MAETAYETLDELLAQFGLDDPQLREILRTQLVDNASDAVVVQKIRATSAYKQRFPGMALRGETGAPAITEFEYLTLEAQYAQEMKMFGMPPGFYDQPSDFADWIGNNRSVEEIRAVVSVAEQAVNDSDPETIRALRDFYGVTQGDVLAYYLDPKRAVSVIEERRRLAAAGLAAAAETTVGQRLDQQTAEALEREGVQRREIQQRLAGDAPMLQQTLGEARLGQEAATASEVAAAEFGLDSESTARIRELRQARQANLSGQSGQVATRGGILSLQTR